MLVKVDIKLYVHISLLSLQGNNITIKCSKFEMKSNCYLFHNSTFMWNGETNEHSIYKVKVSDVAWFYLGEAD